MRRQINGSGGWDYSIAIWWCCGHDDAPCTRIHGRTLRNEHLSTGRRWLRLTRLDGLTGRKLALLSLMNHLKLDRKRLKWYSALKLEKNVNPKSFPRFFSMMLQTWFWLKGIVIVWNYEFCRVDGFSPFHTRRNGPICRLFVGHGSDCENHVLGRVLRHDPRLNANANEASSLGGQKIIPRPSGNTKQKKSLPSSSSDVIAALRPRSNLDRRPCGASTEALAEEIPKRKSTWFRSAVVSVKWRRPRRKVGRTSQRSNSTSVHNPELDTNWATRLFPSFFFRTSLYFLLRVCTEFLYGLRLRYVLFSYADFSR